MPADASRARLTVRFWGVRGSLPTPREGHLGVGGNTTCVEVRGPSGEIAILDAGTGARALGVALAAESGGEPLDLHVLFSHFHWDHLQGLPFFAPLYTEDNAITLHAVAEDGEIERAMGSQMQHPFFPVPFEELRATIRYSPLRADESLELGAMSIRTFPLHHPQGCTGYRFEAEGAVFVYATDYEHGDPELEAALIDAVRGADVFYSDAQYTPDEYELRQGWGHTTWEQATRIAKEAGVGRLVLSHHDPSHDDAALERILTQAREAFPRTDLAREGDVIEL
ncbi:MAG TPA: MBL fold metallo-hydrolase [Bacteroidetes bacterium]|nr:MBL fold metallo-hydrolase [Bacteroidota bacterium]HIL58386.1 MBL fold metallo-hydrolase [Rhodothermales bacterium]